ncbi:NADH-quinone oxidoreductase subunit NuoN [Cellulomonas chengniuliangii]|uniref:NADH-quinone oxidoreductase subunit NuoN n=1 Tax=Cellulomonas chengniuliangii TaxID=2968084 RepID=UPI001D0E8678|nr:NADH-quinone oxidoreductase subunit NuoN [Cellulomonas chengniuliangii]MCC2316841.1 NADH-quinone oxidoreductase subunit NuoN [Cellulomonas chengniuliangii]
MNAAFTAPEIAWAQLTPIILVLGAGVLGVLVEAFAPRQHRRVIQLAIALLATAGALVAAALLWADVRDTGGTVVLGGSVIVDGPTVVMQGTIAILALLSILVVADRTRGGEDAFAPQASAIPGSDYEEVALRKGLQQTEVYPLLMFATGGMLIFPATGDLLTLFVALEVLSLPLYLLTGLARRRRLLSQEASMKYFLLGSFASALLLFGIALLYGFSGSLRYAEIAAATQTVTGLDGLLIVGSVLVLVGLLFKVGAVPFQQWTPDVYQGAPTPITGFMAAGTKIAAFGALLRVFYVVMPGLEWDLEVGMWAVAILTMVVGTIAALVQTDMKRMLAYSSIAHAGFVLTGVIALNAEGIAGVMFYLIAYGAATVGAFGIVSLVRERSVAPVAVAVAAGDGDVSEATVDGAADSGVVIGEATHLSQWAGLGRTHPWTALTFTLFLLSFAGIPLTAGFMGKFTVFSAAVAGGAWPLALIGVLASAAAVFFYVRIIVLMFFTAPAGSEEAADGTPATSTTTVVSAQGLTAVAVAACAVITIALGVAPSPVLDLVAEAAKFIP